MISCHIKSNLTLHCACTVEFNIKQAPHGVTFSQELLNYACAIATLRLFLRIENTGYCVVMLPRQTVHAQRRKHVAECVNALRQPLVAI